MKTDAVIFDLDGTLIDSMYIWESFELPFLQKRGIVPPADLRSKLRPMGLAQASEYLNQRFQIMQTTQQTMAEIADQVAEEYDFNVQLKPYAKQALERLARLGIPMCIVTASEREHVLSALNRLHAAEYFQFILTCTEEGMGKDNPEIFCRAAHRMGIIHYHKVLVLDDALYALKAAKQAGFSVGAVYDSSAQADKSEICGICDYYYHSLKELEVE